MDTDLDHVGGCMANYSKFIKLLLSFVIAISPILLINNANAAIGGWNLTNPIAQGASTLYDASKNVLINGKNVVKKSSALITPTATNVAKLLGKGVAGVALSVAVEQLLGAVDWVLDPANNQITYTEKSKPANENLLIPFIWATGAGQQSQYIYSTAAAAGRAICAYYNESYGAMTWFSNSSDPAQSTAAYVTCYRSDGSPDVWDVRGKPNPIYDPNAVPEDKPKSIPLETVAQKVISNAEGGDAAAQQATKAAAADIVAEAETDSTKARPITKQLEANAETATDETATGESVPKDPTAPDATKPTNISLEFPKFCGWAPSVCEAAQVVISFPTLVTEWWESANNKADGWASSISQSWAAAKEWATSEPSQDNTQVDVENNNTQEIDTQVSFSSQCPANIKLADFSYHGISQSWDVDFSKFCDVFATYLRPVVISIGAFSAVLIVSGVGVRENG